MERRMAEQGVEGRKEDWRAKRSRRRREMWGGRGGGLGARDMGDETKEVPWSSGGVGDEGAGRGS